MTIPSYKSLLAALDAAQAAVSAASGPMGQGGQPSTAETEAYTAASSAYTKLAEQMTEHYPNGPEMIDMFARDVHGRKLSVFETLIEIFFAGWDEDAYTATAGMILTLMIISGMGLWWSKGLCISFFYGFMIALAFTVIPIATTAYTEGNTKKYLFYTQTLINICAMIYVIYKVFTGC